MNRARTRIGKAGPKGMGVFAAAPIRRSTRIASLRGRPKWIWEIPQDLWPHTIQVDYDRYVVPRRDGTVWYVNHSCAPNCAISGNTLAAMRDIREGEELTFDYATNVDWPGFKMECSCGSRGCRKVVRAYRFLPSRLKRKYGRNVAPFILREYFLKRGAPGSGAAAPAGQRVAPR